MKYRKLTRVSAAAKLGERCPADSLVFSTSLPATSAVHNRDCFEHAHHSGIPRKERRADISSHPGIHRDAIGPGFVSSGLGLPLRSPPPVCYTSATSQARPQRASLSDYEPRLIARDRSFQEMRSGGRALRKQRLRKIHVTRNGYGPAPRCCLLPDRLWREWPERMSFRAVRVKDSSTCPAADDPHRACR